MLFLLKKIWNLLWRLIIYGILLSIGLVILFRFFSPPVTPLMVIRLAEQYKQKKEIEIKKTWVSIQEVSPNLVKAVIAAEDQNFYEHWGFDFKAIEKAVENNKKKKKRIKGGSTISQQVAKNLFLWPGRNWIRKGLETYFTLLIELLWSKERIMEVYLNIIEMGDGIYGAEAASRKYFNRSAKNLSKAESALLASVLPNPRRWSPLKPTNYILRKQQWILRNMANLEP